MMEQLTIVIYFAVLAGASIGILYRPGIAFGVLTSTYFLEQWAMVNSSWFVSHNHLANYATGIVAIYAVGVRTVKEGNPFKPLTPMFWLMVATFGWMAMSLVWTLAPREEVEIFPVVVRDWILFGLLMCLTVRSLDDVRASLNYMMLIGILFFPFMIFDEKIWAGRTLLFETGNLIGVENLERGNPLAIGTFAGQVAIVAMLANFRTKGFTTLLRIALVVLGLALTFKSASRGQVIGIVAAGVAFLPLSRAMKNIQQFLGTAIVVALMGALTYYLWFNFADADRFATGDLTATWEGTRLEPAKIVLSKWLEYSGSNPLRLLVGMGYHASYRPDIVGFYPHLVMAETLGELGIIGFALLWLFPIFVGVTLWKAYRLSSHDPVVRGLFAAIGGMVMFDIVLSFKQGSLVGHHTTYAMAIILQRMYVFAKAEADQQAAQQYYFVDDDGQIHYEQPNEYDLAHNPELAAAGLAYEESAEGYHYEERT